MNILIDTSVWSLALRRKTESFNATEKTLIAELAKLIREGRWFGSARAAFRYKDNGAL
jgi:hypothetical protein